MPIVLRLVVAFALLPFRLAFHFLLAPLRAAVAAVARPLRLRHASRKLIRAYRSLGVMADGVVRVRDRRFAHPAVF